MHNLPFTIGHYRSIFIILLTLSSVFLWVACQSGHFPIENIDESNQTSQDIPLPTQRIKKSDPEYSPLNIGEVKSWAYQLQGIDTWDSVEALASSPYDLIVIEPIYSIDNEAELFDTQSIVTRIKDSFAHDGVHRKLVFAYVNIGQAEDYRWYWSWSGRWECRPPLPTGWPDFILSCDPDGWEGNYPVAYWERDWKNIILYGQNQNEISSVGIVSSIAEVLDNGFDGVYLDWVAGFEDESVKAKAMKMKIDPAYEMGMLLKEIRVFTHKRNPNFLLIQQNGSSLAKINPPSMHNIDAIAQECIWYCGEASDSWEDQDGYDLPISQDDTNEIIGYLERYQKEGIPVFNVDYAEKFAREVYINGKKFGFISYVSRTSLSQLGTPASPGILPDE